MALRLRGERDGEQALLLLNVGDTEFRFAVDAAGPGGRRDGRQTGGGRRRRRPAARPRPHSWTILALSRRQATA